MLSIHRGLSTWNRAVSRFIAPTEFARSKFIEGGLCGERIAVKPNFVNPDPGVGRGGGGYALFVGRLSEEKGLETLLSAWREIRPKKTLKIAGDGPLAASVREAAASIPGIEWLGSRTRDEVSQLMADAAFLVAPSVSYETFGLVLVEALAAGLPVFTSRLGAMAEVVSDGETGRLFTPGSSAELAEGIAWAFSHPDELRAMRHKARREFEDKYSADSSYKILTGIYEAVQRSQIETLQ
jgi:glycosyltransferase involved in cell wall biosynthesis